MHELLETTKQTIEKYNMLDTGEQVTAALSGGADSVSLVLALKKLGYDVRAVHVNHGLRGEESERDMRFCESFCEEQGVKLDVFRVDVKEYAEKNSLSCETAARELRYEIFEKYEASGRIATAHTADDCLETTLFNLSRGTGIKGLCGVPVIRGRYVRPFVNVKRKTVEDFLRTENQSFVTDSTNLTNDYSRNKIRHLVVPQLENVNKDILDNYIRARENLESDNDYLEEVSQKAFLKTKNHTDSCYDVFEITDCHDAVKRRVFKKILQENNVGVSKERILSLENICRNGGKLNLGENVFFVCKNGILKVTDCCITDEKLKIETKLSENVMHDEICFFDRKIVLTVINTDNVNKNFTKPKIDYDKIKGLIVVRNRCEGDRVRLAKRDFTSSVKKLFNAAFDLDSRHKRVILSDSEGIIFLEKFGVAQRVLSDGNTKRILEIMITDI